jgi:hypothetical protein
MFGCVFGGLTAIALHLLDLRTASIAVALLSLVPLLAGLVMQVDGARKLKKSG